MKKVVLPAVISEENLVEFDLYTPIDRDLVNNKILLKDLEASTALISLTLAQSRWKGYSYNDGISRIGYGTTKDVDGIGLTEEQAYSHWLENFKNTERRFKKNVPLSEMTQTQYDALLSLYYHTGSIKFTGSDVRQFPIHDYIKQEKWNYVATALVNSGANRLLRQTEARIMMLGDYGKQKSRVDIKEAGIQDMRKRYVKLDELQKKQAEYVYYSETRRFMPNMPEIRKRQIVNLYNQNN